MTEELVRAPSRGAKGGRPLEFDPEATIAVVIDLFWRHGCRATSIADIEAATGLKRTSLYNYFGSKDDLIRIAVERYSTVFFDALTEPLVKGTGGLDDVDRFFGSLHEFASVPGMPNGCLIASYISELASIDAVSEAPRRFVERIGEAFEAALERAARDGEIASDTVARRARLLEMTVLGIYVAQPAFLGNERTVDTIAGVRAELASWRI